MNLVEQNKELLLKLQDLVEEDNLKEIQLIGENICNQHPSLIKSFSIMTENYLDTRDEKLYKRVDDKLNELETLWKNK